MIIKEYVARDSCNKNRIYVDVKCIICNTTFTRQKRQLTDMCCSPTCRNINIGTLIELKCDHCGNEFLRSKSSLNNSKSGKYFCSRECKDSAQKYMIEIQPEHYGTVTGKTVYREKALKYLPNCCNRCGFSVLAALQVHHIDRNRDNNNIENLEILCANCHSIEHLGH